MKPEHWWSYMLQNSTYDNYYYISCILHTNNISWSWQVGDFGLSRIKRNTLVSGGVRGTLPWMAPELLNGSSTRVSEKVILHAMISCFCASSIKPFT